jgi:diguanylate cyclase (GGDEF)-like protein
MRLAVQWGGAQAPAQVRADECWALRRGRAYHFGAQAIQLPCAHAEPGDSPHFCLPVVAQSETIGLLHLSFAVFRCNGATAHEEFLRRRWTTALTCAEQISLAVANVRLRNELEERSLRDPLTRLHNRRWLLEQGEGLLRAARAAGDPFTLVALDIDHFKRVNDTFGHDAGDRVLDAVGTIIGRGVADIGYACRIGGEEFAVLLPRLPAPEARRRVDTLRDRLAEIAMREGGEDVPRITVSAGVAEAPRDGESLPALLKAADRALYAAKSAGRDRVMEAGALSDASGPQPRSTPGRLPETEAGPVPGRRWRDAPPSGAPSTDAAAEANAEAGEEAGPAMGDEGTGAADGAPREGPDQPAAPPQADSPDERKQADSE